MHGVLRHAAAVRQVAEEVLARGIRQNVLHLRDRTLWQELGESLREVMLPLRALSAPPQTQPRLRNECVQGVHFSSPLRHGGLADDRERGLERGVVADALELAVRHCRVQDLFPHCHDSALGRGEDVLHELADRLVPLPAEQQHRLIVHCPGRREVLHDGSKVEFATQHDRREEVLEASRVIHFETQAPGRPGLGLQLHHGAVFRPHRDQRKLVGPFQHCERFLGWSDPVADERGRRGEQVMGRCLRLQDRTYPALVEDCPGDLQLHVRVARRVTSLLRVVSLHVVSQVPPLRKRTERALLARAGLQRAVALQQVQVLPTLTLQRLPERSITLLHLVVALLALAVLALVVNDGERDLALVVGAGHLEQAVARAHVAPVGRGAAECPGDVAALRGKVHDAGLGNASRAWQ
eukprot:9503843-Pyramimonas_sp.AAC.3